MNGQTATHSPISVVRGMPVVGNAARLVPIIPAIPTHDGLLVTGMADLFWGCVMPSP